MTRRVRVSVRSWIKLSALTLVGALSVSACAADAEESSRPEGASSPVESGTEGGSSPARSESTAPSGASSSASQEASPSAGRGSSSEASGGEAEDPGLPKMPAVAKENSEAGAEAFALWYVETWAHLFEHPAAGILDEHSGDGCKTCGRWIKQFAEAESTGEHAASPAVRVRDVDIRPLGDGKYEASVRFQQLSYDIVDRQGAVVQSMSPDGVTGFIPTLEYRDGWVVTDMPVRGDGSHGGASAY
ncbi:DUF6318 family protein [Kytococcus sp. Marseille-QA3725]